MAFNEPCGVCSEGPKSVYHVDSRCPYLAKWGCTVFDPIDTTQPLYTSWYGVLMGRK